MYQSYLVPALLCCEIPCWFWGFSMCFLRHELIVIHCLWYLVCGFTVSHERVNYQLCGTCSSQGDAHWNGLEDFELIFLLACVTPEFIFELPDFSWLLNQTMKNICISFCFYPFLNSCLYIQLYPPRMFLSTALRTKCKYTFLLFVRQT